MRLKGKLVSQISIKSEGDVFQLFKLPHHMSDISPDKVQSVDLQGGQWGTVGSIVFWNYNMDGEKKVAKEIIEAVDETKKSITYEVIEGDVMEFYNALKIGVDVTTNGEDNLVTWSIEYEKKSEAAPDPSAIMDLALDFSKEIERQRHLVPN